MGFSLKDINPLSPFTDPFNSAQDLMDSFSGKDQQRSANQANLQSAREQMAFQERMSSTAHQREVADLKLAGINPVLSGQLGGSSTPSGAMATVAPLPSNLKAGVGLGFDINSAIRDNRVAQQNMNESQSRADLNSAQAIKTSAETDALKGGWTSKVFGTATSNLVGRIIDRMKTSAIEGFHQWQKTAEGIKGMKDSSKGPGDKTIKWIIKKINER